MCGVCKCSVCMHACMHGSVRATVMLLYSKHGAIHYTFTPSSLNIFAVIQVSRGAIYQPPFPPPPHTPVTCVYNKRETFYHVKQDTEENDSQAQVPCRGLSE